MRHKSVVLYKKAAGGRFAQAAGGKGGNTMRLREIAELLDARVLSGEDQLDKNVDNVFCTDLMADVLRYASSDTVLITRLLNLSVVHSSVMAEIHCVVFSDSASPAPELLALAEAHELAVMETEHTMFTATEKLLDAGLSDAAWI